ncbi:MAG: phosphate/phosphite/phosphonate ABC transporter substrate-binding protein [Gammaproteobacteria bacterium]|nr:phosphate/phosphite/phosphonate ABC transporter substrate-binding protein [Gammaproteobacteria bacterium]
MLFVAGLSFSLNCVHAETLAAEKKLVMGFFPLYSTVELYKKYGPLKDYLEEQLGQTIRLETAKDFPTFVKRTSERRYDIAITAPHFGLRAVDQKKYRIIATHKNSGQQLVLIHKDKNWKTLGALRGKKVGTGFAKALTTRLGKQRLIDYGITAEDMPSFTVFKTHNAAVEAIQMGNVDAVITTINVADKMISQGKPIKILDRGITFPNMPIMVAADQPASLDVSIQKALLALNDHESGRSLLTHIGSKGFRIVDAIDYEMLRPYVPKK